MKMLKKSPWVSNYDAGGCNGCILEIFALITPRYDIERFGCQLKESARHADILLVSGIVNNQSKERLKTIYDQMAGDKKVIAIGSCAISGGPFKDCYNFAGPVDKIIPVDMYIPGCPPRPEAIMDGILKLLGFKDDEGKKQDKKRA
ncbi:MAG: NADH-quinone oxidoreductase subunit NuoB [Candidatus Aenigmarchaeota archaeon]|nr:NADH-quinone oxidoreductase subunit NuoB [Candidatus Aenigmarchaeota archaeon]